MDKTILHKRLQEIVDIGADAYYEKYRKKLTMSACTTLADAAFSLYIRAKEPYCACCGKSAPEIQPTCGHLFSRIWIQLRWDEDNAAMQCMGCNMKHEHNPETFRRVMVTRHGADFIDSVWDHRQGAQIKAYDRIEIASKYYSKYLEIK